MIMLYQMPLKISDGTEKTLCTMSRLLCEVALSEGNHLTVSFLEVSWGEAMGNIASAASAECQRTV